MKQNLRRILMCAVLAGLPFLRMKALDWVPVGDNVQTVNEDTWAFTGGTYESKDYIGNDALNAYNLPFTASNIDHVLNIYGTLYTNAPSLGGTQVAGPLACPLKINGNVVLDATSHNMTINIREDVVIEPYFQPPTGGTPTIAEADCSQIYFNVALGNTITVNARHNLEFTGKTTMVSMTEHKDLLVTFAGSGTVIFNMADGVSIKFTGQIDTTGAQILQEDGTFSPCPSPSTDAGGTKVFVLMDQTQDDITAGRNKVVFQRPNLNSAHNDERVLIEVGPNSVFTYLSDNPTGLPGGSDTGGYAAVAFDPSNNGTGRMVLFIQGAYMVDNTHFIGEELNPDYQKVIEKYPFNDGAVVVAGHFVTSFDPATISGCVVPGEGESTTPGYDFSKPAGINAFMRVVDNQLFAKTNSIYNPYNPGIADRRGLLVVNDVINHGKLASDPYWDLYNDLGTGQAFAYSNPANALNNVRKGYVVGVNGTLDIYHNTFIDHASGATTFCDPLAVCDYDPSTIKPRNPSAFITDGLDISLFVSGNPLLSNDISDFTAANPYTQHPPVTAQIQLRGTGTVYVRESGASDFGYLWNLFTNNGAQAYNEDVLNDKHLDWTGALQVGTGTYNCGQGLSVNAQTKLSGEGEHVFDVEGPVDIRSIANDTEEDDGVVRNWATIIENAGIFNAATILLDYTGREIFADGTLLSRPLLDAADLERIDGESNYARYNSPTLFFNNFAALYNSTLRHSDGTKFVDGVPALSEPGITGGERLFFAMNSPVFGGDIAANIESDPNRYRLPEIQFFNSTLELMESLNASGVRFVAKDIQELYDAAPGSDTFSGSDGDNYSIVRFFDHGDPLDTLCTGYGRIFLCGSSLNLMCDGSSNGITESCYWNIFKHNHPALVEDSLNNSSATTLSLQNGDQFHPDVAAAIVENPSLINSQRAHHLFMFAQPALGTCNMEIGWGGTTTIDGTAAGTGAPAGDAGAFPGSFPYPAPIAEPLITDTDFFTTDPFTVDALTVPAAVVSIDGTIICFGSFDVNGNSLPIPVATDNDSGVVYVKHGGDLTITRPFASPIPGLGERTSIPYQCVFDTMIAQRVWNDYNNDGTTRVIQDTGIVDLPHDQVVFGADDFKFQSYGVQPYNFTQAMFAARRADTEGLVRLSFEDQGTPRYPYIDNTGASEVVIGWFYRDLPDLTATLDGLDNIHPIKTLKRKWSVPAGLKYLLRATESVGTPAERPLDLLYIGPGDDITQMRVAGATMSDPFVLDISGDGVRPVGARVREFTSLKSTRDSVADRFISEGGHAVLFGEFNGRFGLGSRAWNEHSLNAWNLIGKDYVTIAPLGDMIVDINSNVLMVDRLPLIATEDFSASEINRLTFFSSDAREIRIPAGTEWDLSSFGQSPHLQQIAFGGNVKLVVEQGATIRFPQIGSGEDAGAGVVLYFNDQSELIFEGAQEPSVFLPFSDVQNNPRDNLNDAPITDARIHLLGQGQIWANKEAHIRVNGSVFVGVESDELTPFTDVIVSIQRQGRMDIGDANLSGGAFQVGNPTHQGNGEEGRQEVNFKLMLKGPDATFHIDREGFFGLAAGIINKNGAPNGNAVAVDSHGNTKNPVTVGNVIGGVAVTQTVNNVVVPVFNPSTNPASGEWQVTKLYNVNNITIINASGTFEHKNIFDGSSNQSSLIAVGPASEFTWSQGNQNVIDVRGGGNIMFVPNDHNVHFVNIWNYAGPVAAGEQYSILASGALLLDRHQDIIGNGVFTSFPAFSDPGKTFTTTDPATASQDFFSFLSYNPFNFQGFVFPKRVDLGSTNYVSQIAYTTEVSTIYQTPASAIVGALPGAEIRREPSPSDIGGSSITEAEGRGWLLAIGSGQPTSFTTNP